MPSPFTRERRNSFDDVAEDYDRARPGYPEELICDVIELSGLPPGGRVLEVGCGTCQATLDFAARGYEMVCLEVGERLATIARRKLRPFPNARVVEEAFEEWQDDGRGFDLAFSATAFHWIDQDAGYAKLAKLLRPGGSAALFWNVRDPPDTEEFRAIREVYRRHAPHMIEQAHSEQLKTLIGATPERLASTGQFGEAMARHYDWEERYTADKYITLLNTYSDHRMLPQDTRVALLLGIKETIDRFGGSLVKPHHAILYVARKE